MSPLEGEGLKCDNSNLVTAPTQQGKSECARYVECDLHPQTGAFVGALLASELTVHLQQFPSPPPLYCLSEKPTLKAISECSPLKVSALSLP